MAGADPPLGGGNGLYDVEKEERGRDEQEAGKEQWYPSTCNHFTELTHNEEVTLGREIGHDFLERCLFL